MLQQGSALKCWGYCSPYQQRRAMSEGNSTTRIQRSTPKRAPLDISTSHSQYLNLTISTQTNLAKRRLTTEDSMHMEVLVPQNIKDFHFHLYHKNRKKAIKNNLFWSLRRIFKGFRKSFTLMEKIISAKIVSLKTK